MSESYERIPPEDQLSLKRFSEDRNRGGQATVAVPAPDVPDPHASVPPSGAEPAGLGNVIGEDFSLAVPTVAYGNPAISVFSLPNPQPGHLLDLTWSKELR